MYFFGTSIYISGENGASFWNQVDENDRNEPS